MVPEMLKVFVADTLQRVACLPPRGKPEPEVWWEREGQRVPTEGRVYQDNLDLVFSPTEVGDSGTYTCVAQNKAGRRTQEVTFAVASEFPREHVVQTGCIGLWVFRRQGGFIVKYISSPQIISCSSSPLPPLPLSFSSSLFLHLSHLGKAINS